MTKYYRPFGQTGSYSTKQSKPKTDALQVKRVEIMEINVRVRQAKFIKDVIAEFSGELSTTAKDSMLACCVNTAVGTRLIEPPTVERFYTATEIAQELGVSPAKLGELANIHGLKTEANGMTVLDKSPHSNKQLTAFRYNEKGKEAIKQLFGTVN